MKKNELIVEKKLKIDDLKENTKRVILDGSTIKTKNDFLDIMAKEFDFPWLCDGLADRYLDFMRDLTWQNYESYELIIINQKEFIRDEPKWRSIIIESFLDCILPYWEHDVLYQCVGGQCKEFNVYLVDSIEE